MKSRGKTLIYPIVQFLQTNYDSVLLFIGYILLFYLCMHLVKSEILLNKTTIPDYLYQKSYYTDAEWSEDAFDKAGGLLESKGVNCTIRWIRPTVGPASEESEAIIYLSAEAFAKKEHMDLEMWDSTENAVLIEGRIKPMSYVRDGQRYISINGMEFKVLNIVLKNELLAYNIHVNWKNLDKEHKQMFLQYQHDVYEQFEPVFIGFPIYIQSLTALKDKLEHFEREFAELMHEGNYMDAASADRANIYTKMKRFYLIMGGFVITCFYSLTKLWFERRKREFLIRRMLGYGGIRLWGRALREAWCVTFFSFVSSAFILIIQMSLHIVGNLLWHEMLQMLAKAFLIAIGIESTIFALYIARLIEANPTQTQIESAEQ